MIQRTEVKTFKETLLCDKCQKEMVWDGYCLASNPPQYKHRCSCGEWINISGSHFPRYAHYEIGNPTVCSTESNGKPKDSIGSVFISSVGEEFTLLEQNSRDDVVQYRNKAGTVCKFSGPGAWEYIKQDRSSKVSNKFSVDPETGNVGIGSQLGYKGEDFSDIYISTHRNKTRKTG